MSEKIDGMSFKDFFSKFKLDHFTNSFQERNSKFTSDVIEIIWRHKNNR